MKLSNKKENNLETLKWIYRRTKRYLPFVVFEAVILILVSLSFVYLALLSKDILDVATGISEGSLKSYGIKLIIVIVAQILLSAFSTLISAYTNGKLIISLRSHLFVSLSKKKYSNISAYHSGDLLNRLTSDIEVIVNSVNGIIPNIAYMIAKIAGAMAALISLDKRIAVIIIVGGITIPALGRLINKKFKIIHKNCQQSDGITRSFMQESIENIVVMKTFQGVMPFTKKLSKYLLNTFHLKMKRARISTVTHLCLSSFFTIGYYAVLIWGASQISNGIITYGTLTAFLQLFQQVRAPMQNITGIMPQYYSALASAERLIEIEDIAEDNPPLENEKLNELKNRFESINFKNVTFAYNDEDILKDCSFTIPKNKITALTGESGSGKSTVFKILLSLYEQQSGTITINEDIPLDSSLRGIFAYVPQGNLVLSGSIIENLTLCNESISMEKIIEATKAAEIYDLIKSMPDGFDTVLSERGAGLSEGQIQRIAIARALLTDAPVLLLDEATSALDEETETKVLDNIKNLHAKTILFVTHRNTSLKVCDRIIHVENKKFSVIKE